MERLLLTGANGFIGRYTLPLLSDSLYEVHAVTRTAPPIDSGNIQWHQVDLLDSAAAAVLVKKVKPTCLLHLAWVTKHGEYWESPANLDWLSASIELVNCFIEHGGKRIVIAGSCAEYDWSYSRFNEDSTPCKPGSLYGISKYSLFLILQHLCRKTDVGFAWGRVFFLYGEGENERRFVPTLINGMLERKKVECSDGKIKRDFLHAGDAAAALVSLLKSDLSGAVNIASGKAVSLKEIADLVESEFDYAGDIVFSGQAKDQPAEMVAEVERLKQELGWEPAYSLESGIKQVAGWWRQLREGAC
jgi:nucleoside-diphosphate-sugar epimerase